MFFRFRPTVRCALATFLLCLPAAAGWARGDAGAAVAARGAEAPAPAAGLADQIDALLSARFLAAGNAPSADARRDALNELDHFAVATVEGLIEASPSSEMRTLMDARLRPILARHQDNIAAALTALGAQPSAHNRYASPAADGFPHVANAP
jgi:hypothetical protein